MLESLVARAYTEIHETRALPENPLEGDAVRLSAKLFRRHLGAFRLSLGITLLGCAFGWFAIRMDERSKAVLMPFQHLLNSPAERVQQEEKVTNDRLSGGKATFSADLMTHNIQVTVLTLAMGMTWGVGTLILLFYNGVILGAVAADYITAGFGTFLTGWLLPHGSVEIPAILLGGTRRLHSGRRSHRMGRPHHPRRPPARGGPGPFRHRRRGGGHAGMGRYGGVLHFAIPSPRTSLQTQDRFRMLGTGGVERVPWLGGPRMKTARQSRLSIETPEGVVFAFDLATPVTRALAWAIDAAAIGAASYIIGQVSRMIHSVNADFAGGVAAVSYFVISIGYAMVLEWRWRGQTIGKRVLGLRVIDVNGLRLQLPQIAIRNLLRFIDMLPLLYLVGGLTAVFNRRCQRLGDLAANTVVTRERKPSPPDLEQIAPAKYNSLLAQAHLAARLRSLVSPEAAALAVRAVSLRDGYDPLSRIQLFAELAKYFRLTGALPRRGRGKSHRRAIRPQRPTSHLQRPLTGVRTLGEFH